MTGASSAHQVYGTPTTPLNPGHGGGTLPVTGFEVVVLIVVALALVGLGVVAYFESKGDK